MPSRSRRIEAFNLPAGRLLGNRYVVNGRLGSGWEGEVYKVTEIRTGVQRAAKLFFPHRNPGDAAVRFYATKLDRLRRCPMVIQYHHSETIRFKGRDVTCLISEFVEGELLTRFVRRQRGRRLPPFQAMHLLHTLAAGLEHIHKAGEYHGDLHSANVLVKRSGIFFDAKVVDFYQWGRATSAARREDVIQLIHVFHETIGGAARYASAPPEVKSIVRGLRRGLITQRFPTARALREHLETFDWPTNQAP